MSVLTTTNTEIGQYILMQVLKKMVGPDAHKLRGGLCWQTQDVVDNMIKYDKRVYRVRWHLLSLMGEWPGGSGDADYPIKAPIILNWFISPQKYFNGSNNFRGRRLKQRISLIVYLMKRVHEGVLEIDE